MYESLVSSSRRPRRAGHLRCGLRLLGDRGIVELVTLCGYYTLVSFTLNAFEVTLPPGVRTHWRRTDVVLNESVDNVAGSGVPCSTHPLNKYLVMDTDQLTRVFAALADPIRRDMIARLTVADATVSQLAEPYEVSMQAVSKHLKVLEDAGLVTAAARPRPARCTWRHRSST